MRPGRPIMYVARLVPTDHGRHVAFGRLFSGTLRAGQKVRIMGAMYTPGKRDDLFVDKALGRVQLVCPCAMETLDSMSAGNLVGLDGIDQYIATTATVSDSDESPLPLRSKRRATFVVRVAVEPQQPSELPKLMEGIRWLCKSDTRISASTEDSGLIIVAGGSEEHVEAAIRDVEAQMGIQIKRSPPSVAVKETVSALSSQICLSKSPNKQSRPLRSS